MPILLVKTVTISGLSTGLVIAGVGVAGTLALVALIAVFHKALNIYRGTGLLAVIALLGGLVYVMYQLLGEHELPIDMYAGTGAGLTLGAWLLLRKGRTYVPPAMLPPAAPPTMLDEPVDDGLLDADPFG